MEDVARAVDVYAFLDKFFPVPEADINAIYRKVIQPNVTCGYDGNRWKGLPDSQEVPELAHYKPLAAVTNAIREAAASLSPNSVNSTAVEDMGDAEEDNGGEDLKDIGNGTEYVADDGQTVEPVEEDMDIDGADEETDAEEDGVYATAVQSTQNPEAPCNVPINGVWLDRHATPPQAKVEDAAAIRPDLIFASFPNALKTLDKEISELRCSARIKEQAAQKKKAASKDPAVLEQVWWQQIHTPFEVKRDEEGLKPAIVQLFNYLRRILQEQLDRRFAIGLLLYFDHLAICMCDRSGGIFTRNAFSIHESPRQFIRVIAGFSLLKPQQFGWDPGMKVFLPTENRGVPSYTISPKQTSKNNYRTYWLIDLPSPDGGRPEQVVTVRGISLARAEVMCGRATIVWEVIKYSEFPKPKQLYVLKRYWRPTEPPETTNTTATTTSNLAGGSQRTDGATTSNHTSELHVANSIAPLPQNFASTGPAPEQPAANPTDALPQTATSTMVEPSERIVAENYFYHLVGVQDERLEYGGDITIDGVPDSTLGFIRQGLLTEPASWKGLKENIQNARNTTGSKRTRLETDDDGENMLPLNHTAKIFARREKPVKTIPRVHTQLLMKDPGPSIKYFCSLMELVCVTRDCIKDHKKFHAKKVLHRDISPGNMIIIPTDSSWKETKGRLIDFDHAKHTTKEKSTALTSESPPPPRRLGLASANLEDMEEGLSKRIGSDIIAAALGAVGHAGDAAQYIKAAVTVREKYFGLTPPKEGVYHCSDLGWDKEDKFIADFQDRQARIGFRNGTLPYMSYEVLAKLVHCVGKWRQKQFFHDVVHDVDSFGWVLIHICLTRRGPGMNMHRDELLPCSQDMGTKAEALREMVNNLFDGSEAELTRERRELLAEPSKMDNEVIHLFHDYFASLGPMIQQWWHTLVLAYQYRAFEYFHAQDFLIEILERTIAKYKLDAEFENIEDKRMKEEIAAFNGLDNVDTKREINRRINHYTRALTVFERPPDAPGQNSFTMTPKKDTNTQSMPAPRPDPESPSRPQNSRKKPRV